MTDKEKLETVRAEIEKRISCNKKYKKFENVPEKKHQLIIEGQLLGELKHFIDSLQEEPVSEDLEQASEEYAYKNWQSDDYHEGASEGFEFDPIGHTQKTFKAGAEWQKEQFEKNRLFACDKQTEKEAEIESDFVMSIIEKEHRQPTFDDAIKYGMRLQKEQMIKEAVDGQVVKAYTGLFRFSSEEISNDDIKKKNLKFGDKVKLIII